MTKLTNEVEPSLNVRSVLEIVASKSLPRQLHKRPIRVNLTTQWVAVPCGWKAKRFGHIVGNLFARCVECGSLSGGKTMFHNRLKVQPDFIFSIVRVPRSWKPEAVYDVPPRGKIVSQTPVASFDEAQDDLLRCNQLAMKNGLREWAVIQSAEAGA